MNEGSCRRIVAERSGGMCERCGHTPAESHHHRVKRGQGGKWEPSNIAHLCGDGTRGCHGWIEANPAAAREEGWALRRGEDPRTVSVAHQMLHGQMMFMDDAGCFRTDPHRLAPSTIPEHVPPYLIALREQRRLEREAGDERHPIPERLQDMSDAERGRMVREIESDYP